MLPLYVDDVTSIAIVHEEENKPLRPCRMASPGRERKVGLPSPAVDDCLSPFCKKFSLKLRLTFGRELEAAFDRHPLRHALKLHLTRQCLERTLWRTKIYIPFTHGFIRERIVGREFDIRRTIHGDRNGRSVTPWNGDCKRAPVPGRAIAFHRRREYLRGRLDIRSTEEPDGRHGDQQQQQQNRQKNSGFHPEEVTKNLLTMFLPFVTAG